MAAVLRHRLTSPWAGWPARAPTAPSRRPGRNGGLGEAVPRLGDGTERRGHYLVEPGAVRAAPVHPPAGRAAGEGLVGAPGARLEHGLHVGLARRGQQAVARGAPGPG